MRFIFHGLCLRWQQSQTGTGRPYTGFSLTAGGSSTAGQWLIDGQACSFHLRTQARRTRLVGAQAHRIDHHAVVLGS